MRIGIYGGTFDPPHIGHENILKEFIDQIDLDKVYVMPTYIPPHKQVATSVDPLTRLEMAKLAFNKISDKVIVSDLEIIRKGMSFTADTISYFVDYGEDNKVFLLCGTDMFLTLGEWRRPCYIFKNSTIVYAKRKNDKNLDNIIAEKCEEYYQDFDATITSLNINTIDISSTEIRNKIRNNEDVSDLLSKDVIEFIHAKSLYKEN
ncbi:MAG: nicotinate (nicotinamide) nucleotide adenylyltransferase [Clostridia bacterium]|nr:nicotinate (nicotinamide) nucleotide adenylyltransferase [Clostridia bacterium]